MTRELIFSFTKKDFKIDWFSGTGAGGQHRNKHQNCCRISHIETGFMETGQNFRERPRNQKEAFNKLAKRLVEHYIHEPDKDRYHSTEVVRTYHQPDNRVKDHKSGFMQSYDEVVGSKDLSEMMKARLESVLLDITTDE